MPTITHTILSMGDITEDGLPKAAPMKSIPKKTIIPNLIAAATTNTHVIVLILIHFLSMFIFLLCLNLTKKYKKIVVDSSDTLTNSFIKTVKCYLKDVFKALVNILVSFL